MSKGKRINVVVTLALMIVILAGGTVFNLKTRNEHIWVVTLMVTGAQSVFAAYLGLLLSSSGSD